MKEEEEEEKEGGEEKKNEGAGRRAGQGIKRTNKGGSYCYSFCSRKIKASFISV